MAPITPCIWLDGRTDEAVAFWCSLFPDSRRVDRSEFSESAPGETGATMVVRFELMGRPFMVLNGGPDFPQTPAVSFMIECDDQAEVDRYWDALLHDGGVPRQCGWLADRFGVNWQVVPRRLGELLGDPDPARADRAMQAMLQMQKLDVAALEAAASG